MLNAAQKRGLEKSTKKRRGMVKGGKGNAKGNTKGNTKGGGTMGKGSSRSQGGKGAKGKGQLHSQDW